jgi:hypothetical protein
MIEVFNAKGVLVKRVPTNGKTDLFVPMMSKGVYFYRVKAGGSEAVRGSVVVR